MALVSQERSRGYSGDSQDDISPFISVSDQTDTPDKIQTPATVSIPVSLNGAAPKSPYTLRIQSNHFYDDQSAHTAEEIKSLIQHDLFGRITQMKEGLLVESMFPDEAFGFPVNEKFVENFYGSFLSESGGLDKANFKNDGETTEIFLNRTIATIAQFLDATKQVTLKPLRYFSSAFSSKPLSGHQMKRKPDVILVSLIDGSIPDCTNIRWDDVQAFVEHTIESRTPQRLPDTVSVKSYLTFCAQPERDFLVCLCFTGKGFHIVVTDHVGQIETDLIPFSNSLVFLRILMGLAFLPDNLIGKDATITRHEAGKPSSQAFITVYQPFPYNIPSPSIKLMAPSSPSSVGPFTVTSIPTSTPSSSRASGSIGATPTSVSPGKISTISVGRNIYKVDRVLFKSRTLIGRATTVFLVKLPDNRYGVLKDSWITTDRLEEAAFIQGPHIPFGPELVDNCILRNTHTLRGHPMRPSPKSERREKRRIVTYPAGVHISDFTSLWELLVAFLDIVIGMED
jgi:hypothetical protein